MKKPIYLYVLLTLSSIGVLSNLYSSFFASAPQVVATGNANVDMVNQSLLPVSQASFDSSHGIVYRIGVLVALGLLIKAWHFLVKKDLIKTNMFYIGYQILSFILAISVTMAGTSAVGALSGDLKEAAVLGLRISGGIQIVTFLIMVAIPVFKLYGLQKASQKEA